MELKDFIVTPFYILLLSVLAYFIRPYVTDHNTRRYFLPALWVRFVGAIALGLLYQFHYGEGGLSGDTFKYYKQASVIYEAFGDNFVYGLKLLFADGEYDASIFNYTSQIRWYQAGNEYFIIRVLGLLSILTFNTYSAQALFFATFNFAGLWMMFSILSKKVPNGTFLLSIGILFLPSSIFWGSGILKDTLTLGALGILFWSGFQIIEKRRMINLYVIALVFISTWVLSSIKIYILISFVPALIFWAYLKHVNVIKNRLVKLLLTPVLFLAFLSLGYLLTNYVASESDRYNLDSIAEWSYITSNDIRYWTGSEAGSGYDIGEQDGTWPTLLKLVPAAVNVTLFRPYLWEVRNPLMLLAGMESLFLLIFTLRNLRNLIENRSPLTIGMLAFSFVFAFAVGASTYNFGSLSRYKIPLLPFYISAIVLSVDRSKISS